MMMIMNAMGDGGIDVTVTVCLDVSCAGAHVARCLCSPEEQCTVGVCRWRDDTRRSRNVS